METEKQKMEIEKLEQVANEIFFDHESEIKDIIIQADEGSAFAYNVVISGEKLENLSVTLVQNGSYNLEEKYEITIPCVLLSDYINMSDEDVQDMTEEEKYEEARGSYEMDEYIQRKIREQLSEYKEYIKMDKKIVQWSKENNNIGYNGEEIAQLSFENKDGWLWEDWDFLYGNNPDNFPDDEKLPVEDEDFGTDRFQAIKGYVNLVMYEYFKW